MLSANSNNKAVELLLQNQDKINWYMFSFNPNDKAIQFLDKNIDKIKYYHLIENKNHNVINLLKNFYINELNTVRYYSKIHSNPIIFEIDYKAMKINNQNMYEELIKEVMKPSRVFKNPDYDYIEELFGD